MREWQRPQQHGIDHTKDGAVSSDPQRESKNGDDREGWRLQQHAERVFEVGNHKEAPNSKHRAPEKFQTPIPQDAAATLCVWSLELLWSLDVGAWSFIQ